MILSEELAKARAHEEKGQYEEQLKTLKAIDRGQVEWIEDLVDILLSIAQAHARLAFVNSERQHKEKSFAALRAACLLESQRAPQSQNSAHPSPRYIELRKMLQRGCFYAIPCKYPELNNANICHLNNLSARSYNAGNYREAAELYKKLLGMLADKHSVFYQESIVNYSEALCLIGKHQTSIQELSAFVELLKASRRSNFPTPTHKELSIARAEIALANSYNKVQEYKTALKIQGRAVEVLEKTIGPNAQSERTEDTRQKECREYWLAKLRLANMYGSLKNGAVQKEMLLEVLRGLEALKGSVAHTLDNFRDTLSSADDIEIIRIFGNLGIALMSLGEAAAKSGHTEASRAYYQQSLDILQHVVAVKEEKHKNDSTLTNTELAFTLHNLGMAYGYTGQLLKQLEYFDLSLEIKLRVYKLIPLQTLLTLNKIAETLLALSADSCTSPEDKAKYLARRHQVLRDMQTKYINLPERDRYVKEYTAVCDRLRDEYEESPDYNLLGNGPVSSDGSAASPPGVSLATNRNAFLSEKPSEGTSSAPRSPTP